MRTAIVLLALAPAMARADVATWFWTVNDTGNGNGLIEPGESALLTLALSFDPRQDQFGGMFGDAGPYDILGNAPWAAGHIEEFDNLVDDLGVPGVLDGENYIREIENFQYAVVWDTDNDTRNPIDLYFIRWTPAVYEPAIVTLDNGGPDAWIYTDPYGERLLYTGQGGAVSFSVVPAPATAALAAIGAASWRRRRRE